ncbi:OmpL47-type beta-barrel domain-containing protein [Streptomyces sp. XM4193]|uniref:OmpL47-type beta-barrel domain-containing protein n=1 Tax=Streptomyces sp. XM4193 TaxID=2929782 RepID=UPI0035AB9113
MRPPSIRTRRTGSAGRRRRPLPRFHLWTALAAAVLMLVGLVPSAAMAAKQPSAPKGGGPAALQTLTWTADDSVTDYKTAPTTAVAGETEIVFENSEATGNTTNMPHTLTFDTSNSDYNNDVSLNILANPSDSNGGKHTATVTLTPGTYRYYCTIPGHGQMQGTLEVTEDGGGEDTTPPEVTAKVDGTQNEAGDYVGSATVTLNATDEGSGVEKVEYALGEDGEWQPYTDPFVIDEIGDHVVRHRATDKAGNVSEEGSEKLKVVSPPTDDTEAPETSATVSGEKDEDGNYLGMATVTVTASDEGSGVNTIEYALGDDGEWQRYEAPVMVHEVGDHKVRYRATDKAGNQSEEASESFTIVEPPAEDTTPPEVTAKVEGEKNSSGAYLSSATVNLTAKDEESGVAKTEYSLDSGPYLEYKDPVIVDRIGRHTVAYRATDEAGNTSEAKSVSFTIARGGGVPAPNCAEFDERGTVFVGEIDTGIPNRITDNRCRINERIEDEKDWSSQALFLKHVKEALDKLLKEKVIDQREHDAISKAAKDSGIGTPGNTDGYRKIFDGTEESLAPWEQVGGGEFILNEEEGSITSSTETEGMGMLWFTERRYDDFSLKFQWRDDAPADGHANAGAFVRFPKPHDHPEEERPEWVAIKYGHEIQINDSPTGDMYKTGSVYGFDRVGLAGSGVTPKGTWNDYEVRVVNQKYEIYRNGELINEFQNSGGQSFVPARDDDPGTDGRRYASGYLGLQVHGTTDVISYRDIRVKPL